MAEKEGESWDVEGDPSKTIYCHPSQDIGSPTTTSDLHVDVEALTACIGSVQVKDTPKSRRPHGRGSRRIYRGKALFHAEDEETMQVVRTEKSGNIVRNTNWTEDELRHLTSFLMLHTDGKSWVSHKDYKFWDSAGEFIQQLLHTSHCRSGKKKKTNSEHYILSMHLES